MNSGASNTELYWFFSPTATRMYFVPVIHDDTQSIFIVDRASVPGIAFKPVSQPGPFCVSKIRYLVDAPARHDSIVAWLRMQRGAVVSIPSLKERDAPDSLALAPVSGARSVCECRADERLLRASLSWNYAYSRVPSPGGGSTPRI